MRYLFISIVLATTGCLIITPTAVAYAETSVINTISAQTTTGGNTASHGTVTTGESRATVDITTIVDGEMVEDIHEEARDGESVVIKQTIEARTTDTVTTTDVKVHTNAGTAHSLDARNPADDMSTSIKSLNEMLLTGTSTASSSEHATTTISNVNEARDEASTTDTTEETSPTLLTRVVEAVTRAIAYVLSNLFS